MITLGWGIVGVFLGVVGSEILRAKLPRLVGKVEDSAKRFVDSFSKGKADEAKAKAEKVQGDDNPFA